MICTDQSNDVNKTGVYRCECSNSNRFHCPELYTLRGKSWIHINIFYIFSRTKPEYFCNPYLFQDKILRGGGRSGGIFSHETTFYVSEYSRWPKFIPLGANDLFYFILVDILPKGREEYISLPYLSEDTAHNIIVFLMTHHHHSVSPFLFCARTHSTFLHMLGGLRVPQCQAVSSNFSLLSECRKPTPFTTSSHI